MDKIRESSRTFRSNARESGGAGGVALLPGTLSGRQVIGVSPKNAFFFCCAPPQAARRGKEEAGDAPATPTKGDPPFAILLERPIQY